MNRFLNSTKKKINFSATYYYCFILLAFSLPLSRAVISFFLIFLPLVWLIEGDLKQKFTQIKNSSLLISMLLFLGFMSLSFLWSSNTEDALNTIRILVGYWFTIFVIATVLEKKDIKNIITAFLLGMLLSEIIAYGVFFGLWEWGKTAVTMSPIMGHIEYSIYLAFTSILLLSRLISKNYDLKTKIFIALFFISTTGNLFLSIGRIGQLAYIVAVIVMFCLHYKLTLKSIIYAMLTLVIIYTLAFNLSNTFQNRLDSAKNDLVNVFQEQNYNTSWGIRIAYWHLTFDILKEHPLIGVGVGDYKEAYTNALEKEKFSRMHNLKEFVVRYHSHNQYLMVLTQAGLIGFALMFYMVYRTFQTAFSVENKEFKDMFILFLVIYLISFLAEPMWYRQFPTSIWIFMIGILASYSIHSSKVEK